MEKEKLLSDDSVFVDDMEMKDSPDTGSEIPPLYPGSTPYQTPAVIIEPESYPATTPTPMSELPPSDLGGSDAISQPKETTQHTRVTVVTSQPSRVARRINHLNDSALAENMLGFSVFCCIICCLCGSPLTLICFVPAIILLNKRDEYESNGDPVSARNAFNTALVLTIIGIISGIAAVVIFAILRTQGK